jgi:SET domain-containing protein
MNSSIPIPIGVSDAPQMQTSKRLQDSEKLIAPVHLADSAIAGCGVFAGQAIAAGERILRFDDSRHITPENPLRPELGEQDDHVDHLANGVMVYMYEPERYLNHRCDPNVYCRHFDGIRYLVARRPIAAGEELVVDYALNSAVPGYSWHCQCGAHNCRSKGHLDFFQLPAAIQRGYFELLDGWFIAEYRDRLNEVALILDHPGF